MTQPQTSTLTHLHLLHTLGRERMVQAGSQALSKVHMCKSCCFYSWHCPCALPRHYPNFLLEWLMGSSAQWGTTPTPLKSNPREYQEITMEQIGGHCQDLMQYFNGSVIFTEFAPPKHLVWFSTSNEKCFLPWQIPHISGNAFHFTELQLQLGLPHQSSFTSFLVKDL